MHMLNKKFLASFWLFSFMVSFAALSYGEVRDRYFKDGLQFHAEAATMPAAAEKTGCTP